MELTVADVLGMDRLELGLLAGAGGLHRSVRWAHAIELTDPVPWLLGGELVLTIGLGLPDDAAGCRAYVERLKDAGCAGLGFAAEVLDEMPAEVLTAADELDLPVIGVLGTTPFIAVSMAVAGWYSDAARRAERHAVEAQEALARAALRAGADGLLAELARRLGGAALLLDTAGRTRSAHPATATSQTGWHIQAAELAAGMGGRGQAAGTAELGGETLLVHSLGLSGPPRGWLAALAPTSANVHRGLIVNHAAVLLSIHVLGIGAVGTRLHEQRARLLGPLLDGTAVDIDPLLLPRPPFEVLAVAGSARDVPDVLDALDDVLGDAAAAERMLVVPRTDMIVLVLPDERPRVGPRLVGRLAEITGAPVRAGAATARETAGLATAGRQAADVVPAGPGYVHADEVSAWAVLRDGLRPSAVAAFTTAVLGPLRSHDERNGSRLVESLHAYLDAGANLEAAAAALGVHRNTLRARLAAAQRIAGRDLSDPAARLELWLALSAAAVLSAPS
ncbi:PucR family transcriptional regulator [Pseudonocardia sp. TRM90224]|uniref:PucR family transcriptional regulator n=1 Tax=Pseudonocardia sp. TRM90224 TaxID=2812678 RepID=UPI001E624E10|nr:PucR family transcriptional regulator ligand-binding domain-containing protein [Pseudonocardia sp. TRM90224]